MSWLRSWHEWRDRRARAAESGRWRREHVAGSARLSRSVHVLGWNRVRIGAHTLVSDDVWLNVNDRTPVTPALVIGANCFIGRRNLMSSGHYLEIGDYCLTSVDCHFLGADHIFASPFVPYVASGTTEQGEIRVGPNCWLGAGVTVLKGVRIGYGSIIGARSLVNRDVPPLSIAVGNPARVVRRYDPRVEAWLPVAEFTPEAEALLPSEADYLRALREKWPKLQGPLIAASQEFGDL